MKRSSLFAGRFRILDVLLILQAIALVLLLWHTGRLDLVDYSMGGDGPSYLLFPFSPVSEALSSHRTFGLPLIVRAYRFLTDDMRLWPGFQLFFYLFSVFFLYRTLLRVRLTRLTAFATATGLLWSPSASAGLKHIETETFAAVFLLLTVSFLFRAVDCKTKKAMALLGISVFFLYQIRSNMAFVALLIPVWGYAIARLLYQQDPKQAYVVSLKLLALSVLPLLAFCSFRYVTVGDFGLVSLSGTVLSGQATARLNHENIKSLQGETRDLADEILQRKIRLSPPCNKLENLTDQEQHECGNIHVTISWLAGIKKKLGTDPFDEPEKNREPWKHKNLSPFFSVNNAEIDALLKKYSFSILRRDKRALVSRLAYEYLGAVKFYFGLLFGHRVHLFAVSLALLSFGITKFILPIKLGAIDKGYLKKRNSEFMALGFIAVTIMVSGALSSGLLVHLLDRYLMTFSLLLPSLLLLHALPPFAWDKPADRIGTP